MLMEETPLRKLGWPAGPPFRKVFTGVEHAETIALAQAGDRARGATLFLNLEPCSHQGRTPPCADALIRAGVAKVVAPLEDPNPLVAGQGFRRLRHAGIEVELAAEFAAEASKLNEPRSEEHTSELQSLRH